MSLEQPKMFEPVVYYSLDSGGGMQLSQDPQQLQQSAEQLPLMSQNLSSDHQLVLDHIGRTEIGEESPTLQPVIETIKNDLIERDDPLIIFKEGQSGDGGTSLLEVVLIEALTSPDVLASLESREKQILIHILTTSGAMEEVIRRGGAQGKPWGEFDPEEFRWGDMLNREALQRMHAQARNDKKNKHIFIVDMVGGGVYPALDLGYTTAQLFAGENPVIMQVLTNKQIQDQAKELRDALATGDPVQVQAATARLQLDLGMPMNTPEDVAIAQRQQGNRFTIDLCEDVHNQAILDALVNQRIALPSSFGHLSPDEVTVELLEKFEELRKELERNLYIKQAQERGLNPDRVFQVENPLVEGQKRRNIGLFKDLKVNLKEVLAD